jgi:ATP-dependent exoDNAse (exonuclease V) beta subunit
MATLSLSQPYLDFPNIAISASAGTGKTFQLSNRYLALINAGEVPDRVLAVTFTRKAAGEILDRILTRLAEAAATPDTLRDLHSHIGGPALDRSRCLWMLRTLLHHIHRLRVSTLDGFFIQIAGALALELGLPSGWKIVDEIDDQRLRAEAMSVLLSEDVLEEIVSLIRSLSKEEATRTVIDLLTSVATDLYPLAQQTQAEAWQALPRLPRLGDGALKTAIKQLEALEFSDKRFTNAHVNSTQLAQQADWVSFVTQGLASQILAGTATYYKKPIEAPVIDAYQPLVEHARALLLDQIADQCEATRRVLDRFGEAYEQLKWQRRSLRFDDVTRAIPNALTHNCLGDLTYRLDAPVTHVLVDEFQDTSLPQWQAIEPFAEAVSQQNEHSFFCVGDVKQAIYSWRGGISELMEAVTSQLPNISEERLNQSYRSSQIVIDTVNAVFANLGNNPVLATYPDATAAWSRRFETHTTVHAKLPGYACLATARLAMEGEDQVGVTLEHAAAEVANLHHQFPDQTIGILVRRNQSVARLIDNLRRHHGIAASEEGGNPLTDSVAVQCVLSLLRLGDHPGDTVAGFHVAHSPLGKRVGLEHHDDKPAVWQL